MTNFVGELLPHQTAGLEFLLANPRCLLADEVGLGKTVQAAALIGALTDRGALEKAPRLPELSYKRAGAPPMRPTPVLWITAAGLVSQTVAELQRFLPSLAVLPVKTGVVGDRADRERMAELLRTHPAGPDVLVTTHALADSRREHFEALEPVLVVVDEASALKAAGPRHEAARWIGEQAERVVAMTATPQENDPLELWAMLSLIGLPDLVTAEEFGERYVSWRVFEDGSRKAEGWLSPAHAHEVMRWVGSRFLRRTADGIGQALPRKVDSWHRVVPLSPVQQRDYNRAGYYKHWAKRHQGQAKAARVGSDGSSTLLDAVVAEATVQARDGLKVVLYVEHLDLLGRAADALTAAGVGNVTVQGEDTKEDRADAVAQFRDDPRTSVLLGTKVLEHGLNLQFAHVLISAGVTFNPARERQREGRLCRLGSPNETYRHMVFLPGTPLMRKQLATLARKAREAAPVLDAGVAQ